MALGDNAVVALFDEGDDLTAAVTAAVSAGHFVKISATVQGGPLLDVSTVAGPLTGGNLMKVATCGAGEQAFGVAKWDAPTAGDVVGMYTGNQIVPMIADGAVTAGDKIMAGATGNAKTWVFAASDANNPVGIAISTAVDTAAVYVKLTI